MLVLVVLDWWLDGYPLLLLLKFCYWVVVNVGGRSSLTKER